MICSWYLDISFNSVSIAPIISGCSPIPDGYVKYISLSYNAYSLYDIMIHLRDSLVNNLIKHAEGQIAKHKANVEIYFTYPTGIGEHPDVMGAIETELNEISRYHEQITVLKEYFDA